MYNKPKNLVWHEKHLTALMVARPTATDTMELAQSMARYKNTKVNIHHASCRERLLQPYCHVGCNGHVSGCDRSTFVSC